MANNYGFLVPAMFIFLFASGLGCLFLVIAWAKVLMDPEVIVHRKHLTSLYAFTASVGIEALGSGIATMLPDVLKDTAWLFVLLVGFVLIVASLILLRQNFGPQRRTVKIASIVLFVVYGIGFLGMIGASPGIQPH